MCCEGSIEELVWYLAGLLEIYQNWGDPDRDDVYQLEDLVEQLQAHNGILYESGLSAIIDSDLGYIETEEDHPDPLIYDNWEAE